MNKEKIANTKLRISLAHALMQCKELKTYTPVLAGQLETLIKAALTFHEINFVPGKTKRP